MQEVREAFLAKEKAEEEFRELADAVEMATLDKEMAEERVRNYTVHTHYVIESTSMCEVQYMCNVCIYTHTHSLSLYSV